MMDLSDHMTLMFDGEALSTFDYDISTELLFE